MLKEIENRRSIRKFKPDAVPEEMLAQALGAARFAPSAKNDQPWRFLVLGAQSRIRAFGAMERGLKRRMAEAGEPELRRGLASAVHTLRVMRAAPVTVLILRPMGTHPCGAISGSERIGELLDAMSVGAAVENLLLEAQRQGLGALWIGNTFFAYDEICRALALKGQLLGAVALGFPDEAPQPRARRSIGEIVEFLP